MYTLPRIKLTRQLQWAVWGVATVILSVSALDVWSKCCACGYQTPQGLFTSVTLAATAWVGVFLPYSRSYFVRVALDVWVILTTMLLGRHLLSVKSVVRTAVFYPASVLFC